MQRAAVGSAPKTQWAKADGFSLVEVMVATLLLATAVVSLAQLFGLATRSNIDSRNATYMVVLAGQKLEELRALTWGFDTQGVPVSDTTTDTSVLPETTGGGSGLSPSPGNTLLQNTAGYVDHIDQIGARLGGGTTPPPGTIYTRRWAIQPLPADPENTLVIQVLVTRSQDRRADDDEAARRVSDQARLITVRTRKGR
jgi:type II secretory pathway pseudopilin PulG